MASVKPWIEAMRLRTLPVGCAGVVAAWALACADGCFRTAPAVICLIFAVLAQIASNFANEYFDFRGGLDRKGREGPRRGVTEGDISPNAMLTATCLTVGAACGVGLSLLAYGGWWLIAVGALVVVGVFCYSTGPYPLSHHALGEVAVVFFFGIIPVSMTYYLMAGTVTCATLLMSVGIGLMGANILIVNNYRDVDDDRAVGKATLATRFGRRFASSLYLLNALAAMVLAIPTADHIGAGGWCSAAVYLVFSLLIWRKLTTRTGRELNPVLGMTAMNMFLYSLLLLLAAL